MRILENCVLREHYDVIVVGAGLGGMTAASLLAKRGLSVLMIDQQSKPGGSCTSFKREDVVFDVGTAMIYGFGDKGFKPFRFLINELEEPIEIIAHPTLARMTFEGQEIIFWPDVNRFLDELGQLYPAEKAALRAFYADLYKMYENIVIKNEVVVPPSEFSPRQGLRRLLSDPLAIVKMQRLLYTSVKDLLDRYFHTPEIVHFFDKLCSAYAYTTAAETPAVLAATMFLDNHIGGVYYPAGGAQMLPNTIEKAFERDGGQALYGQLVDEILIRDGRAYGVRLANGVEILADRVIANTTVWNLYGKLVRPEHIPPERLAWAQSLVPTYPSMTLYMVVDRAALPEDVFPWEIFIENRKVIDNSDLTLYINALVDHTLCPPGKLAVMAIAPNMCAWPSPDDPAYHAKAYRDQKKREAERMIAQIDQHYPGFSDHIETLIIGTPTTIERYMLKNGGAVGGPKNAIGQHMLKRLHARSEWKNLYVCGDSTVMGTGAPATMVSGVGAANMVLRDLHKPEYDTRKFPKQYVQFVEIPYTRPKIMADDPITLENAHLAAAQCQGCEHPACVAGCPAGINIPGFLRRMEARNYIGAARLLRERNPFAEVCGYVCAADALCQKRCYRKSFAGAPVRIAELERWVCETAGHAGWLRPGSVENPQRIAVLGGGPAGLSCAYYLALTGRTVDVYGREAQPGGQLLDMAARGDLPVAALNRDLQGLLVDNIHFVGQQVPGVTFDIAELCNSHSAVYVTADFTDIVGDALSFPGMYVGAAHHTVVEAVAEGRRIAVSISENQTSNTEKLR
ncbi:MAG TPA: NAD(P)-binding protein [Anaerolineae bacterium]|nr:NAD(P)-binding protein [Anaerolineae bacterium]HQK14468.1 NAD(P)-binding protein [Anaerolineae bacterium]